MPRECINKHKSVSIKALNRGKNIQDVNDFMQRTNVKAKATVLLIGSNAVSKCEAELEQLIQTTRRTIMVKHSNCFNFYKPH